MPPKTLPLTAGEIERLLGASDGSRFKGFRLAIASRLLRRHLSEDDVRMLANAALATDDTYLARDMLDLMRRIYEILPDDALREGMLREEE